MKTTSEWRRRGGGGDSGAAARPNGPMARRTAGTSNFSSTRFFMVRLLDNVKWNCLAKCEEWTPARLPGW